MARGKNKGRRLVVGGHVFLWKVRHSHRPRRDGQGEGCAEVLLVRREGARGQLRVVFREGPGGLAPAGYPEFSGGVTTRDGPLLNLHEPGTARAVIDEATERGWDPDDPPVREVDGWTLFDAVAARRA